MLTRVYKLPIRGRVLNDKPLTGDKNNPLCIIPLSELPGYEDLEPNDSGFSCVNLNYDIDEGWCEIEVTASEALHEWLLGLMPRVRNIAETKGWKVDKTELEKTKKARGDEK
ncbi:hypothetical protein ES706_06066 [subsurface metagenome]